MPIYASILERLRGSGRRKPIAARVWQSIHLPPEADEGWRTGLRHRVLFDAGIHLADFILEAFDESPLAVWASLRRESSGADTLVSATLEFSEGRLAQLYQARRAPGRHEYFEAQVDTPEGAFRASFGGVAQLSVGLDHSTRPRLRLDWGASGIAWIEWGDARRVIARNPPAPNVRATAELLRRMIAAIETGGENPSHPSKARAALEVVAGCYLSAESGRKLSLTGPDAESIRNYRMGDGADGR
jgi:predicted dehydrogenase